MVSLGIRFRTNRLRILNNVIIALILLFVILYSVQESSLIIVYILLGLIVINFLLLLLRLYFIHRSRLVTTITYNNIISEEEEEAESEELLNNQNSDTVIVSINMENYEYNLDNIKDNVNTNYSSHGCCSICMNDFENGELISRLECNHEYHEKCIGLWIYKKSQCPLCKKILVTNIQEI